MCINITNNIHYIIYIIVYMHKATAVTGKHNNLNRYMTYIDNDKNKLIY